MTMGNEYPRPGLGRWQERAACRGMDAEVFLMPYVSRLPRHATPAKPEALAVCATCPVKPHCIQAGTRDTESVRGGLTPHERGAKAPHVSDAECGTAAGYRRRHRETGAPVLCTPCCEANALARQLLRERAS